MNHRLLIATLSILCSFSSVAGEQSPKLVSSSSSCHSGASPDAPLRIFSDDSGQIFGYLSYKTSYRVRFNTPDLYSVECKPVLFSEGDPDPYRFDDNLWIGAIWKGHGSTINALIHNEFHAHKHKGRCEFATYLQCWRNSITFLESRDGGSSFVKSEVSKVVATAQFQFGEFQGKHRGFFNPSNVVSLNNSRYFLAETTGGGAQVRGVCAFRNTDMEDPWVWLAWDGMDFRHRLDHPPKHPSSIKVCKVLDNLQGPFTSIIHHSQSNLFLGIFVGVFGDEKASKVLGSWSSDLVSWGEAFIILDMPLIWSKNCVDKFRYAYPAAYNFDDPSGQLDNYFDSFLIFLTRFTVENCKLSEHRDLVYIRVDNISPPKLSSEKYGGFSAGISNDILSE